MTALKLHMSQLTQLAEWQALKAHKEHIAPHKMQDWFNTDPQRFQRFSFLAENILLDYSKNRITVDTLPLLCRLAEAVHLKEKINDLFSGKIVNHSEQQPALHTALRTPRGAFIHVNGKNILPDIHNVLDKMRNFTEKVRGHIWRGATGKPIRHIINIGIGGSHLGPLAAISALTEYTREDLSCYFISNIDSAHIHAVLKNIDPETTLFILSSKSFTTLETITHANTLRVWLQKQLRKKDITPHFIAITANPEKAQQWGLPEENIFHLWKWVGGRYSVWSAIGLPLALLIGMDSFLEFLAGAHAMDRHFLESPLSENMPVIMGLLGIWYINFFNTPLHSIIPYSHSLNDFRAHLQQLDMESNGKSITQAGFPVDFLTGPVIFGEQGCNSQHSFHQLLHQGTHLIPVDFILVNKTKNNFEHHQPILIASALSQAKALMQGKSYSEALAELTETDLTPAQQDCLAKQKAVPGNRPSNIIMLDKLTPYTLGSLMALYEHKIFVQSSIWNINCFDQWGVELGKQLLPDILQGLVSASAFSDGSYDSSTQGLIEYYKNLKETLS